MEQKDNIQTETAMNSPCKGSVDAFSPNFHPHKSHIQATSTRASTFRLSETEQEIYTHELVRQIMEASKTRSVHHDINRIPQDIQLYAKPKKLDRKEFRFDSIPARDHNYSSPCHHKVNQIKQGLNQQKNTQSSANSQHSHVNRKSSKNRPLSAASRVDTKNPRVSVNGLVSYNFSSANARKSLGLNNLNHQQRMVNSLVNSSQQQYCAMERRDRILAKTSNRRFSKQQKNQEAIMKDFMTDTDVFLKSVIAESQENTLIYNERAKKLNFMKQYMAQEGSDYEVASYIVNHIEHGQKAKSIPKKAIFQPDQNEQVQLIGRKIPTQRRPLLVSQFQFIE